MRLDVKPGDAADRVNLDSQGVIPVAVLGAADFDAARVDPATVVFANARAFQHALQDVNGNGHLDLVLHFRVGDTIWATCTGSSSRTTSTGTGCWTRAPSGWT